MGSELPYNRIVRSNGISRLNINDPKFYRKQNIAVIFGIRVKIAEVIIWKILLGNTHFKHIHKMRKLLRPRYTISTTRHRISWSHVCNRKQRHRGQKDATAHACYNQKRDRNNHNFARFSHATPPFLDSRRRTPNSSVAPHILLHPGTSKPSYRSVTCFRIPPTTQTINHLCSTQCA